tara:strand:- start:449 stop:1414 length:966 start_codon:yes stop_codon:yes gene_type:complete
MNFVATETTFLRYFLPLIIEGNKRKISSKLFISPNNKYNNPYSYISNIKEYANNYGFELFDLDQIANHPDITFFVEGCGADRVPYDREKISFTYMTDFSLSYKNYIDKVDYVVHPSEFFAKYYKIEGNKNLYLGSPKYDIELKDKDILSKYNLTNDKKALIMFPRNRDLHLIDIRKIYRSLSDLGYKIMVKTRGKDPVTDKNNKGDYYFEDCSWFPHTGMELIRVSDLIINFSSTTIKECVLLSKPVINFHIKPFKKPLDFLYNYGYCDMYEKHVDEDKLRESIQRLTTVSLEDEFELSIQKHLFPVKGTCKRILDYLEVK